MRAIYDLVDLQPVILAARQIAYADQTLDRWLPDIEVMEVDYRLGRADVVQQTVPPRAFDTPATPIARAGVTVTRGGLPAFSPIDILTETDLIRARRLAGLPVDIRPDVNGGAFRTAATVVNTMQLLKGQALATGGITLAANGVAQSVDFGVPSGNKVTPATLWTNRSTAPVMDNLRTWHDTYVASAGGPPGAILTTTPVLRLMLGNAQVIAESVGTNTGRSAVTLPELNALLAANDLPSITTFDRQLRDVGGTMTTIFPTNKLVFLPDASSPVGETQYGLTEEAVELVHQRVIPADQAPGLVVVTMINDDPVQRAVKAAAIGMPVIQPSDALAMLIATVL